jgi:hypothetical protein
MTSPNPSRRNVPDEPRSALGSIAINPGGEIVCGSIIRARERIESETLYSPELRELVGKTVQSIYTKKRRQCESQIVSWNPGWSTRSRRRNATQMDSDSRGSEGKSRAPRRGASRASDPDGTPSSPCQREIDGNRAERAVVIVCVAESFEEIVAG